MLSETGLVAASVALAVFREETVETVFREGITTLAKTISSSLNSCLYQKPSQGFKFYFGILFLEFKWDLYGASTWHKLSAQGWI